MKNLHKFSYLHYSLSSSTPLGTQNNSVTFPHLAQKMTVLHIQVKQLFHFGVESDAAKINEFFGIRV